MSVNYDELLIKGVIWQRLICNDELVMNNMAKAVKW